MFEKTRSQAEDGLKAAVRLQLEFDRVLGVSEGGYLNATDDQLIV